MLKYQSFNIKSGHFQLFSGFLFAIGARKLNPPRICYSVAAIHIILFLSFISVDFCISRTAQYLSKYAQIITIDVIARNAFKVFKLLNSLG